MKTTIPVNNEILKWARETISLTIEDVSISLKRSPSEVAAWEDGSDTPTYAQLEQMADRLYKRPVALFFFPNIPEEDSPAADFRTLPRASVENLPPAIIKMYRKAKTLQINSQEIYEDINPSNQIISNLIKAALNDNIVTLAGKVREFLGVEIAVQKSWPDHETAFKQWRAVLESSGMLVFKDAFHEDSFSGFCIHSDNFPIIYINNTMPNSRQIFTLFHELCHLLLGNSGIDYFDNRITAAFRGEFAKTEQFCNAFAGEFLVPSGDFQLPVREVTEAYLQKEAEKYSVSREVILRKLLNKKIITAEKYDSYVSKWRKAFSKQRRENRSGTGGNYFYTVKSYLGTRYIDVAFSKYYKNRISLSELADYLFMKEQQVLRLLLRG